MNGVRLVGCGVLALLALALVGSFLIGAGAAFILEAPATLAFGWVQYLGRVVPQMHPDPTAVATAGACLLGVVFGGHAFLRWVYAATGPQPDPRRWPWKWTLLLVGLVVLMFVAGIAVTGIAHQTGWLLRSPEPLVHSRWDSGPRSKSANNLKQIVLAAHTYHDVNHHLPWSTFDALGRPMHSWQTALLPYLEQVQIYNQIDLSKPWTHPDNAGPLRTQLPVFLNPSVPTASVNGYGVSHYAGNVHVVLGDTPRTLHSFTQGTSNTILAGEVSSNCRAWGDPLNARDPRLGADHPHGFAGPKRPPQFVMLDGTVRTFDAKELAELLRNTPE
jgi:hypothetical protein